MTNLEQLLVRACKVENPETRLRSVYRRFYWNTKDDDAYRRAMISILAMLCDKYLTIPTVDVIEKLRPDPHLWGLLRMDTPTYEERALGFLISNIRLTTVDTFPEFMSPAKFRNRKEIA